MFQGRPPKEDAVRRRHRADTVPSVELTDHAKVYGPELPTWRKWLLPTMQWWQAWRTSPQAVFFVETDWHELLCAAVLYDDYWNPDTTSGQRLRISAELRGRTCRFGATYEDRAKLRMRLPKAEERETAKTNVVNIDYKRRLAQ